MTITHLKSLSELDKIFAQGKPSVIDFHATWCGPCHAIAPTYQTYAEKFTDVKFLKCDVDAVAEIAKKFNVSAMPTFMFFKGDQKVDQVRGADKSALLAALNKLSSGGGSATPAAFAGKGHTLTGAGGSEIGGRGQGLANVSNMIHPQLKVLLYLVGAYGLLYYFNN